MAHERHHRCMSEEDDVDNFFKADDVKNVEKAFNDLQTKLTPSVLQALTSGEVDYLPFVAVVQAPFHMGDWIIKPVVHEGQDGIVVTVNGEPYTNFDLPPRSAENLMAQLYRCAGKQKDTLPGVIA